MKHEFENGTLTVFPQGRIDSSNAQAQEGEVMAIWNDHPGASLTLDLMDLTYISSAGLRMILRFRKKDPSITLTNASQEVYDIFEMTGFTEMMDIHKAYRQMSVEGCEVLGSGSNGVVYKYNDELVVKVYRNPDVLDEIKQERDLARKALILGIPTAIPFDVVKVGDNYASVFELLNAKSFTKLVRENPEDIEHYVRLFADLLKTIHSTEVSPGEMPNGKLVAVDRAKFLKDYLKPEIYEKLVALTESIPDRHTVVHGDYHTNNVEMQNDEVLLIDMDTLSYGHPILDIAYMYFGYVAFGEIDPSIPEKFFSLPRDLVAKVWDLAIHMYLDSDDEDYVRSVVEKASILTYTRLMRRTIRRDSESDFGKKQIELCRARLEELVPKYDDLSF